MKEEKHITWVNGEITEDNVAVVREIENRLCCKIQTVSSIAELFPLLSDCKFVTNLILFDLQNLYNIAGVDAFDLINTVITVSKCTLSRAADGKTEKRNPHLGVIIGEETDLKLIKGLRGTEIKGVVPKGAGFSLDEKIKAYNALLKGEYHMPKQILDRLKPHCPVKKNGIQLTPRQEQVLNLICERGASNKVIAKMLNITESTVKLHVAHVFKKYGVRNRTQLVLFAK